MFVRDFARPLVSSVFAEAFGVDRADRERFMHWSEGIVDLGSPTDEERSIALAEEYVEFQQPERSPAYTSRPTASEPRGP